MEPEKPSGTENLAQNLVQAGVGLDQSRMDGIPPDALAAALETNLQTWVELLVSLDSPDCVMTDQVKANLRRLCDYVSNLTLGQGVKMAETEIDTLVNINFQISEGLLEGIARNK